MQKYRSLVCGIPFVASLFLGCAGQVEVPETSPPLPECTAPVVDTTSGPVCGLRVPGKDQIPATEASVDAYLGIKYGQANRWDYAELFHSTETTTATQLPKECAHSVLGTKDGFAGVEDCLSVNVWAPTERGPGPLPVMVFIPGGGFVIGGTSGAVLQGWQVAASKKVVVVTFNYRLGAFAGLGGGSGENQLHGDYGFADQQLALRWVQENISAFGGNPERVILWGESSGAQSVALHLVAPDSQDYFHGVIQESNPYGVPYKQSKLQADVVRLAFDLAAKKHCPELGDLHCLKRLNAKEVVAAQRGSGLLPVLTERLRGALAWSPQVGTERLPIQPVDVEMSKPAILGTNLNEGLQFAELGEGDRQGLKRAEYDAVLLLLLGLENFERVTHQKRYAPGNEKKNFVGLQNVFTDYLWTCPNRRVLRRAKGNAWGYFFVHPPSYNVWPLYPGCTGYACHSYELPFTFRRPFLFAQKLVFKGFTPQEQELSDRMSDYWIRFAEVRRPDPSGQPPWPLFSDTNPGERQLMNLPQYDRDGLTTQDQIANCDLWDEIGYNNPAPIF